VDVVRDRGALARIVDDGYVENVYRLQIMNATEQAQRYRIVVTGLPQLSLAALPPVVVESAAARWVPVAVRLPPEAAAAAGAGSHRIGFVIERLDPAAPPGKDASALGRPLTEKSTFIVPR
jgi:polyferredoxin